MSEQGLQETEREAFGGDTRAINRHSTRTYEFAGRKYTLDRCTDACPPYFTVYAYPADPSFQGVVPTLKVEGKALWGDGISWKRAEAKLLAELNA